MKRLVIAVDCDDVIIASTPVIIDDYNTAYGTSIQLADAHSQDLSVWGVEHDDEAIRRVFNLWETKEYHKLGPIRQSVQALRALKQHHEPHLITGRADFLQTATRQWVESHMPDIFVTMEFTNFIVPTDQMHVRRSKLEACQQIGADILIDDHLHHAEQVAAGGIEVLLFGDYPWNVTGDTSLPPNIVRAKDWQAVLEYCGL